MDQSQSPPLSPDDRRTTLLRQLECQRIVRSYAPRMTLAGFQALTFLALKTLERVDLDLPTSRSLAEAIGVTRSGAIRILATLSPAGRSKGGEGDDGEGYGLIETNDTIGGLRIHAFVLTPRGKECVGRMMSALTGRDVGHYDPHDLDSLFKLLFREIRPNQQQRVDEQ